MGNFLVNLGNAMPAISQMQQTQAAIDEHHQNEAIKNFQLQEMKRKQERLDKPVPIEYLKTQLGDNPKLLEMMTGILSSNNGINNVNGAQFTSQRALEDAKKTIYGNNELHMTAAQSQYGVALQKELGLQNQIKEAQASGNLKKVETLQAQLKTASEQREQMQGIVHGLYSASPEGMKAAMSQEGGINKELFKALIKQQYPAPAKPIMLEDRDTQTPIPWTPDKPIPPNAVIPATGRQLNKPDAAESSKPTFEDSQIIKASQGDPEAKRYLEAKQGFIGEKAGAAQAGRTKAVDPGAVDEAIEEMRAGNPLPMGFGQPFREAVAAELNARIKGGQITRSEVASNPQFRKALGSSFTFQQKSYNQLDAYVKNLDKQIDRFGKISEDLGRFDTKLLNIPLVALKTQVAGSAIEAKALAYITEISTETAKIAGGAQASIREPSVELQERWNKIHDRTLSIKDLLDVMQETKELGNIRLGSVKEELESTSELMKKLGTEASPTPSPPTTPGQKAPTSAKATALSPEDLAKAPVGATKKLPNGKTLIKQEDGSWDFPTKK
jgi:hypothetical protein